MGLVLKVVGHSVVAMDLMVRVLGNDWAWAWWSTQWVIIVVEPSDGRGGRGVDGFCKGS